MKSGLDTNMQLITTNPQRLSPGQKVKIKSDTKSDIKPDTGDDKTKSSLK